jgi:hypothetical protein
VNANLLQILTEGTAFVFLVLLGAGVIRWLSRRLDASEKKLDDLHRKLEERQEKE